jgi:formylglycine-generating enzyme
VIWYQAIRFINWLHNGQAAGNTECGVYMRSGGTPIPTNAACITRSPGATWFLPTLDEWYKAAYHQPAVQGGDADDYRRYATRTNDPPYSDQPPGSDAPAQSNTANLFRDDTSANGYYDGFAVTGSPEYDAVIYLTEVGEYAQSTGFYGTFGQVGNVLEWPNRLLGLRAACEGALGRRRISFCSPRAAPWNAAHWRPVCAYQVDVKDVHRHVAIRVAGGA